MRERATPIDLTISLDVIQKLTDHGPLELGRLSSVPLKLGDDGATYHVEDFVRTMLALPATGS